MDRPPVTYDMEPSFDIDQQLHVKIAWHEDRKQFMLRVRKGYAGEKERWFDKHDELDAILRDTAALYLPLSASGPLGVDGTSFSFTVGDMPAVTLSWWEEIPTGWEALGAVVERITNIAEREA